MTDREKAIVMAYTGTAMLTGEKFSIFYKYIEDILGRPVWTHELADDSVCEEIKEKSKSDFLELCKNEERPQGEWVYGEDDCGQDGWFCSECNFFVPWYYQYYEKDINFIRDYKVCPHCLAEMIAYTGKDRDKKGGADMRKPNCVRCDHFGKCDGCEKGEEE